MGAQPGGAGGEEPRARPDRVTADPDPHFRPATRGAAPDLATREPSPSPVPGTPPGRAGAVGDPPRRPGGPAMPASTRAVAP
jgi:hypothetical protein